MQASVPDTPPDTVPAWFGDDSSYSGGYLKHVIAVRFQSNATTADREAAVAAVCGRVVGGWPMGRPGDGFYAVQVPDKSDDRRIQVFIDELQKLPQVIAAIQSPVLIIGPN